MNENEELEDRVARLEKAIAAICQYLGVVVTRSPERYDVRKLKPKDPAPAAGGGGEKGGEQV